MAKYAKKRPGKHRHGAVIALLAALLILLAGFVMLRGPDHPADESGNTGAETKLPEAPSGDAADEVTEEVTGENPGTDETEEETELPDAIVFPLVLADGKLEIESLIQYDGLNPDCGDQEGSDVAAVTVRNLSDAYLGSAEISMTADNGSILSFVVTDLPAGAAALVFARDNTAVRHDTAYCGAVCEAVFDPAAGMEDERIGVSVAGTAVTLQNKTSESLSNIVVYCHCTLGDRYFGGITYTYTIPSLPADGSTVIEAVDCILGLAEVVRVTINET